jgi:hypothetical protein
VRSVLVGRDEQAAALQSLQLTHSTRCLAAQPQQPLRIALQHLTGSCERAVAAVTLKQPLAQFVLQPANGLADRRLGTMQP